MTKHNRFLFDVESNLYYACFYPNLSYVTSINWWFCKYDNSLVDQAELMNQYGFVSVDEAVDTGIYIPFVKVDILSLQKDYLLTYYPKDIKMIDAEEPDVSFRRFVEIENSTTHWYDYERNALRAAVEQWCKTNGIPYF